MSTIQYRRGTAAEWTSASPTLAAGEIGVETDTGKFKFGNGSTAWSGLGYFETIIPTYTITPDFSSVDEGNTLTFNVGGENITDGTYYWTIESNAGDFTVTNGSFSISSNVGSFTVTPTDDSTTEGTETFEVAIRRDSISGTILQTSSSVTINDTSLDPVPAGQVQYTTAGTYSWVAPAGVTSVSAVVVGGGGGGNVPTAYGGVPGAGGGGGGLAWKNNIAVTPGNSYTVIVGAAGLGRIYNGASATGGGSSSFLGVAGNGGESHVSRTGGTYSGGDGGGNGGIGGYGGQFSGDNNGYGGGGGGAGGYSGNGGAGQILNAAGRNSPGSPGNGGGGGGGTGSFDTRGGGVGLQGEGASGSAGQAGSAVGTVVGGGGGGRAATQNTADGWSGFSGGVRIMWGAGRAYPSTNTGDL